MRHIESDTEETTVTAYARGDHDSHVRSQDLSIAVLIPCLNEEHAIGVVVREFADALPTARIFVYDNGSSDQTVLTAREAGATVHFESRRGKGNVVRRMFADVDADIYVLVDGDGTYDSTSSPAMVERLVSEHLDMVIGARVVDDEVQDAYRRGHAAGNVVFTRAVRALFHGQFTDVLSGYRVMSRRFVKSLPMFSSGFEIETELCAHADRMRAATAEVPTSYRSRHEDSTSKLRTVRDGFHIALALVRLVEETRPFQFFAVVFGLLTLVSLALGIPVLEEYARTGVVGRLPTAVLVVSIQIVAFLALLAGAILRGVAHTRDEIRQMMYLQMEPSHLDRRPR
jgi:glycosyltransferase involved in cell wall biosynthesis